MKLNGILQVVHEKVTTWMSKSWFVENVLIAKVTDGDEIYDCIYCTIVRVALIFTVLGFTLGCVVGWLL